MLSLFYTYEFLSYINYIKKLLKDRSKSLKRQNNEQCLINLFN